MVLRSIEVVDGGGALGERGDGGYRWMIRGDGGGELGGGMTEGSNGGVKLRWWQVDCDDVMVVDDI